MAPTTDRKPLLFILACLLTALLALTAACGGGDDDDDDDDSGPTTEETEDSGDDDGGDDDDAEQTEEPTEDEGDDDDDGGGNGDGTDVCALLTDEEAGEAVGGEITDTQSSDLDSIFACNWSTDDFNSVDVSVWEGDEDSLESLYEFNNNDAEKIDGLGDRAQWNSDLIAVLEVLDDGRYVTVSIISFETDDDEKREKSIEIMEIVLGRLD